MEKQIILKLNHKCYIPLIQTKESIRIEFNEKLRRKFRTIKKLEVFYCM